MSEQISHGGAAPYKNTGTWMRGLFMLLFGFFYHIAVMLLGAVAIIQFVWVLATGRNNPQLTEFGAGLSRYFYQVVRFLTRSRFPSAIGPASPCPGKPLRRNGGVFENNLANGFGRRRHLIARYVQMRHHAHSVAIVFANPYTML